ncbi:hypothetical protein Tco_0487628 [Tanacetum coccineum]
MQFSKVAGYAIQGTDVHNCRNKNEHFCTFVIGKILYPIVYSPFGMEKTKAMMIFFRIRVCGTQLPIAWLGNHVYTTIAAMVCILWCRRGCGSEPHKFVTYCRHWAALLTKRRRLLCEKKRVQRWTYYFPGTTSDIQITTSGCVKRMSLLDADSNVFQRYSQLCARNVRPWFSAAFPEAGRVNSFEPHANSYS